MRASSSFSICLAILLAATSRTFAQQPLEVKSPLSPEESLKHFQLDPLLSIELVAAEPQVVDPVAMRFDEDGRLWVAEMRDYPLGPIKKTDGKRTEKDAEPLSQIKILEDRDGDRRFETATVFADKLLFVTGLQPWKGGVIVTLSGKVAYMKDTDGDGKADVNETWFTGFSESNSQLRANHPTFALDNHIYVANGLRGGMVVNHLKKMRGERAEGRGQKEKEPKKADDAPINISGMDFRFDPLTGDAEAVSGNGQFGLCFDDWGNRFVCSNRNPCQHVVIENRYLKKAPTVAIPSVVQDVAAFAENSRIYPISKFWTTSNLHEGQFTAACGVFIYRGDLLPQQFRGNVFTCDPTGNLIHREIMEAKGATFTSKPAYEGKEFLASPDTWFRPVSMELGPDGALYVVDMYRAVIEHPEWVPDELKNRPDERLGDDRGRIYRIVPSGGKLLTRPVPKNLSKVKEEELVALLQKQNVWQREAAQRLLFERQEKSAIPLLQQIARSDVNPLAVAHAFWLVHALSPETFLYHPTSFTFTRDPQLRQQPLVADGRADPDYLLDDPNRGVRFRALLHSIHPLAVTKQFSLAAVKDCGDPWSRQALRLALSRESAAVDLEILRLVRNSSLIFLIDRPRLTWDDAMHIAALGNPDFKERYAALGFLLHGLTGERDRRFIHLADKLASLLARVSCLRIDNKAFADINAISSTLLLQPDRPSQDDLRELVRIISFHAAEQDDFNSGSYFIRALLEDPSESHDQLIAGVEAFLRGLEKRQLSLKEFLAKSKFAEDAKALVIEQVNRTVIVAAEIAKDENKMSDRRLEAISLMEHFPTAQDTLLDIVSSSSSVEIKRAGISALSRQSSIKSWKALLERFAASPPGIRAVILDGILQRPERISLLLDSFESGSIKPTELDPVQTGRLLKHGDAKIRERAEKIFGSATPEDRKKALADYQSVLTMTGDAKRGQVSFAKNCATCHKVGETGVNVAPDISDSRTKTPAQILADIIQPNRAIDANYVAYQLLLADGTTASGILTAETSTSITLKAPGAKVITVARGEIEQLKSMGVSLMPEGLEKTIPPQEMADVIAFIKNWRYLDGRVPVK